MGPVAVAGLALCPVWLAQARPPTPAQSTAAPVIAAIAAHGLRTTLVPETCCPPRVDPSRG
jgi:hypothetical protein